MLLTIVNNINIFVVQFVEKELIVSFNELN